MEVIRVEEGVALPIVVGAHPTAIVITDHPLGTTLIVRRAETSIEEVAACVLVQDPLTVIDTIVRSVEDAVRMRGREAPIPRRVESIAAVPRAVGADHRRPS
jgi:hypothetical protein